MSEPSDSSASKSVKDLKGADSFTLPQFPSGQMPQNMGLADLARGLQYVVNETAMAAYLHTQKTLDLYFDADGNPLCRRVRLPGGAGVIDVPKLALTPPANLLLEQMEVSLAVRITNLSPASEAARQPAESDEPDAPEPKSTGRGPHIFVAPADGPEPSESREASASADAGAVGEGAKASTPESARSGDGASPAATSRAADQPAGRAKASSFALSDEDDAEDLRDARSRGARRGLERLSFEIQPAPVSPDSAARRDANVMDIKMIFRRNESPEGIARLVALYTESMFRVKPAE
jgi:hypothetical protein